MLISGEDWSRQREQQMQRPEADFVAHPGLPSCEKQSPHTSLLTPATLLLFLTKGLKPHRKFISHVITAFCY